MSGMMLPESPTLSHITVRAEFVTDERGNLRVVESNRHRHYKIRFWVDGAPEDTYAVTYVLHSTYRDPIREVRDDPHFHLDTTTYGDYSLVVSVRRKKITEKFEVRLSEALALNYPSDARTADIIAALEDIRSH